MHRTQILLEPEQHEALGQLAQREGASVSEIVRRLVRHELERRARAEDELLRQRLEALSRVETHCDEALARRQGKPLEIDVVELIRSMREERDEEILDRAFRGGD